jgi:hypothetical protein
MKYRAYPIRYNKECYQIQIHCYHSCSNINYICSHNNQPCPHNNQVIPSCVNLSSFNFLYPDGHCGSLYNPDNVVIKDTDFTLYINFPLHRPVEVPVTVTQPMTTRMLLSLLQTVYFTIYEEESKTASLVTKQVVDPCFCINKRVQDFLPLDDTECSGCDDCSICFSTLECGITLNCNHIFHRHCIDNWINRGDGDSCPLCRTTLKNCQLCNNTRLVESIWQGKVIPPIYRETMDRNETDGIYNIHTYDFQQLSVEQCIYNPRSKTLQVKLTV